MMQIHVSTGNHERQKASRNTVTEKIADLRYAVVGGSVSASRKGI